MLELKGGSSGRMRTSSVGRRPGWFGRHEMRAAISIAFVAGSAAGALRCGGGPDARAFPSGGDEDASIASDAAVSDAADAANLLGNGDASGHPCVNLQCMQVDCAARSLPPTTVSGVVYDPAGQNPLYDVIVYVPNAPVQPFGHGVTCDRCGVLASGSPVVTALTGPDGRFTLQNVPAGDSVPLVLQLGKWRRQVTIPHVEACTDTPMADRRTMRLPARQSEGDMPLMAIATGGCDPFECLFRKIGIDDSEFTNESGPGRVHLYQGAGGAALAQPTTGAAGLWSGSAITGYDLVVNACECAEEPAEKPQATIDNVVAYANAGGRVFNTHYHYYWIDPAQIPADAGATDDAANPAWRTTATFVPEVMGAPAIDGYVDTTFPKGDAFAQWLYVVGASPARGRFPIAQARYNAVAANPPSTQWVWNPNTGQTLTSQPALLHYTFNTPVGLPSEKQCGKVLYSDFHVVASLASAKTFPAECDGQPMSPQELALEFMLFDLSSCIQQDELPPRPPTPVQ
jgi:hypothetical protein